MQIRHHCATDFDAGFAEALAALVPVGLTRDQLVAVFHARQRAAVRTLTAERGGVVLGTASMFIEPKYYGKVAHVEDVAVHPAHQRRGVGRALVAHLEDEARRVGCYKAILNCVDSNVAYYEALGYARRETQMRKDL